MKKFLLITYYWPPAGGAGVMRWAKMSKYISDFGWQPVIYTPENGEVPVIDESLIAEIPSHIEIVKTSIWEPYNLYKSFLGRSKKEKLYSGFINEKKKVSLSQKISVFIRGNFFIPDARMFWIKPSVRFLKKYLKDHPVDAIISTGPPHSMHMIGEKIHRITGIPWIADFRDPWTNIDFYQDLHLTRWADKKHKSLERKVLFNATKVVTVTWRNRDEFKAISGRDDIIVIPNGFDDADFQTPEPIRLDEEFSIVHIGSMNKDRNPLGLWSALKDIVAENSFFSSKLKIKLIGPVDFSVRNAIEEAGLQSYTSFVEFVPHTTAVRLQQQSQLLLLMINNSPNARTIIPGKLYEYLGSRRPILAIGPQESDSAHVIEMTRGGVVHDYNDIHGIKQRLLEYFELYSRDALKGNAEEIKKFTRKSLAKDYAEVLKGIASAVA